MSLLLLFNCNLPPGTPSPPPPPPTLPDFDHGTAAIMALTGLATQIEGLGRGVDIGGEGRATDIGGPSGGTSLGARGRKTTIH